MQFRFTEEQEDWRREVRAFLEREVTSEVLQQWREDPDYFPHDLYNRFASMGWLGVCIPKQWGGLGRSPIEMAIFSEEVAYASPLLVYPIASGTVTAKSIIHYGTEEQKIRFVPGIVSGQIVMGWGLTEPDAGCDLASAQTRAIEAQDDYLLNGTKIYAPMHYCTHMLCLARTDPQAPKHKSFSLFMVDLKTKGISMRPLRVLWGENKNEVVLENVRVPRNCLVGEKNRGWYHVATTLDLERSTLACFVGTMRRYFDEVVAYVRETRRDGQLLSKNTNVRHLLADVAREIEVARLLYYRAAWLEGQGIVPTREGAMAKVYLGEVAVRFANAAMEIAGRYGQLEWSWHSRKWTPLNGRIPEFYRMCKGLWTIQGGTSEMQRNVIAIRGLGLPIG